ncbi:MAG: SCP2 sterol-binding domain-containing protein [Saprospiraceae bacterium]|nr:SCP2 sterol-binding domain-containing protein [Saprospiraceae bacterium]
MTVSDGLIGAPDCTVTAKSDLLMRILNKEENPMMSVMTGKLKISNLSEMMKFAKIFGLM